MPQARSRAARAPFVVVLVGLLAVGLLGLLGLNTALAQDAFRLHTLQVEGKDLAAREQTLAREVEAREAPGELARAAGRLGMVPGGPPAFLRLPDGAVLGRPAPATAPPRPTPAPGASASPAPARGRAAPTGTPGTGGTGGTASAAGTGSTGGTASAEGSAARSVPAAPSPGAQRPEDAQAPGASTTTSPGAVR